MDNTSPPTEESQVQNKTKSTPVTTQDTQTQEVKIPQSRSWLLSLLVFICLLLCFGGLGAGYYFYTQLQNEAHQLSARIEHQMQAQQTKFTQTLAKPNAQVLALMQQQTKLKHKLKAFESLPAQQKQLNDRVTMLAQRDPEHWKIAEANYLIKMAGRKLWLEQDALTAVALLKSADEQIDAIKDPALLPVRKALARDIASVSAIKNVDLSGTALKLDEMIYSLNTLPLNHNETKNSKVSSKSDKQLTNSVADWRSNLAKTWQALTEDFITVRHRATDVLPLLSPEQKWYLVENIRSKLLQAQLALYRHDEVGYQNSLKMVRDWVDQYYDLSDPSVEHMINGLDAMMKLKLDNINIAAFQSSPLLMQLTAHGNMLSQQTEELK